MNENTQYSVQTDYTDELSGVRIFWDKSRLEIETDVLKIVLSGNNGFLLSDGQKWRFFQPDKIMNVHVLREKRRRNCCFSVKLQYENGDEIWHFYPGLPFLCSECHLDNRVFDLDSPHVQITSVELADKTDHRDSLVKESVHQYYNTYNSKGNMFLLEDYVNGRGLLIVKHSPCPESAVRYSQDGDLCVTFGGKVHLRGCEYGAVYGIGNPEELFDNYKELYKRMCSLPEKNFIMSNTWGDRSRDKAMNEEFVLRELDCAHYLGVDIVQLDDGWQKGISSGSVYAEQNKGGVFEGFYDFDSEFWVLDHKKFPGGMGKILTKAQEYGIEIGLWFAPDSSEEFKNWKKDIDVIRSLTEKYGASYIKLDGVVLRSEECEKNYLSLLDAISDIDNGKLNFNLDITNNERLGYFCGIQYGTLFVENRYTDWKNYYPHRTMRNLWQLSRYLPAAKFQFEVLNPRRNQDLYGDDPLAPAAYDIDWCFASVMASNPLLWMEMQNLTEEDSKALRRIISVYKSHREAMAELSVNPIGDVPNGIGWSGFQWKGNEYGYLTIFRGITNEESHRFDLPMMGKLCTVLSSNTDVDITPNEKGINVSLGKKRGYVFLKYESVM